MQLYSPLCFASEGKTLPFFTATLPLPPSVNESYKIVRVPRKVVQSGAGYEYVQRLGATPKLEAFKKEAFSKLVSTAQVDRKIVSAILSAKRKTPLSIHIRFYFPTPWKKDVDGGIKPVQDACFAYLKLNDNLVTCLSACKLVDADEPRCEIEISCFVGR